MIDYIIQVKKHLDQFNILLYSLKRKIYYIRMYYRNRNWKKESININLEEKLRGLRVISVISCLKTLNAMFREH